jgi:small subunit ribosomal protein S19e
VVSVKDVPPRLLIERVAAYLQERVPKVSPPPWAPYVKTGSHAERPPQEPDWWYRRCASLLRKLYLRGPLGIESLRDEYGGRKRRTKHRVAHHRPAGGSIIRKALQQLEAAELVVRQGNRGRALSPKGRKLLDRLSTEIFKELVKEHPQLAKYA